MTSPSSGYLTVRRNLSSYDQTELNITVPVPARQNIMVTFKEMSPRLVLARLHRHSVAYHNLTGHFREQYVLVWERRNDVTTDFARLLNATRITLGVSTESCLIKELNCFKLFFSFLPPNKAPQRLPSGLWNCSVDHYASFHHHLACNHQTECEDGRDETEHCPFSSPACRGLVAFCGSCYKFISLSHFPNDTLTEGIPFGIRYCNSLGGTLNFPKCICDWYDWLKSAAKMHQGRLQSKWTGYYSNSLSLPTLYRQQILHDRAVIYHSFDVIIVHTGMKECYTTSGATIHCKVNLQRHFSGLVCEFRPNQTEKHFDEICLISKHAWLTGHQSVTKCSGDHLTHAFLLCGSTPHKVCNEHVTHCRVSGQLSQIPEKRMHLSSHQAAFLPLFTCNDMITAMSYTLLCDYVTDCQDGSDEFICNHPLCSDKFMCTNGQCVPYVNICDQMYNCQDVSDEGNCDCFQCYIYIKAIHTCFLSPALIDFNGIDRFRSVPMNYNESCPDSHYRCPGDMNDCLPVFTRCNGMHDCTDHQDEEGCEDLTCPGFFRCRASTTCVHSDHMCDGWPHCPLRDDELMCDMTCPVGCLCQGHTFLCYQPFSAILYPQLRYLDAAGSGMTLSDVNNLPYLFELVLVGCSLTLLPNLRLLNLRILNLSNNQLHHVNVTHFFGLENLQVLSLSRNPLIFLSLDVSTVIQQHTLTTVDLSYTSLTMLDTEVFSPFPRLQILNITFTSIHTISQAGFRFTQQLTELHMGGTFVTTFPLDLFKYLSHLRVLYTHNYKLCCSEILPAGFDVSSCYAPKDDLASCKDLLQTWSYRLFLWLVASLSVTGNVFCFCARLFARSMTSSSGFRVFVINLTMADFLTGVYIAIIGVADERLRGRYLHCDDMWKSSVTCKTAGVLSFLSTEVSALTIWLITVDRFIVLHFPFSTLRFEKTSATVACLFVWLIGWLLAAMPLLPVFSHWELYGQTGVCIPLPVMRQKLKGHIYSFSVFIAFNFVLFMFISAGQAFIYWAIQTNSLKTNTTKMSRDITIARRLVSIAVTNFMCWFPVGICGMLAVAEIPIPGEVNVALAIFVLPLNSAVNPFLYTFNTLAEKWRQSREEHFMKWFESHADLIST